jgi:hypothetical protein
MTRIASNRMAALCGGILVLGIVGCPDDDNDIIDAAIDVPRDVTPDVPNDVPVDVPNDVPNDVEELLECEQRVAEGDPTVSQACASCLCEGCEEELEQCWEAENCSDEVACAREAVADGTCAGDITGAECLMEECDFELTDPAGLLLLCIASECQEECAPVASPDAGVDDDDDDDDDGIIDNGIL